MSVLPSISAYPLLGGLGVSFSALCWHGITRQVPKSTGAVGDAVYGQDSQPTASGFDACALSKRVSTFIHAPGGGIVSTASTCWSKSSTCRESVNSSLSASESSAAWRRSVFFTLPPPGFSLLANGCDPRTNVTVSTSNWLTPFLPLLGKTTTTKKTSYFSGSFGSDQEDQGLIPEVRYTCWWLYFTFTPHIFTQISELSAP